MYLLLPFAMSFVRASEANICAGLAKWYRENFLFHNNQPDKRTSVAVSRHSVSLEF